MTENLKIKTFGRVTAQATHELNNIFAIIQETCGLMEDLILLGDSSFDRGRFLDALKGIYAQVERGIETVAHLNWFSHTPDTTARKMDLNDFCEKVVFLLNRMARIREVELNLVRTGDGVNVETDPFMLFTAIFTATRMLFMLEPVEGRIEYRPESVCESPFCASLGVTLYAQDLRKEAPRLTMMRNMMESAIAGLNADLLITDSPPAVVIRL